jgi:AcrR family transcriptional regulator
MPRKSDAKERMIGSAMKLQRMHGVAGTAFADVIAHSGAPRGSIYHHFPGGRAQLSEAATAYGAEWIAGELEEMLADGDLVEAFDAFVAMWTEIVLEEHLQAGCAVAAGALDPEPDSGARQAAAAGFRRWEELLVDACERQGLERDRAEGLAVTCISAIEGALILVRAEGDLRALELVAHHLRGLVAVEQAAAQTRA